MIQFNSGNVFWDIDSACFKNKNHSASFHIRQYRKEWSFYSKNKFKWLNNDFDSEKNISIIEAQGDTGQAREVGRILSESKDNLKERIAVILGDENLMEPILQYFPKNLNEKQIDFSIPLKESGIKHLITSLLDLKIEEKNFKSIKLINKIFNSGALKKALGKKHIELTHQLLLKNSFSKNTKCDKIIYSIAAKKWRDSNEVLFELNSILQFLINKGKLNEFESQETGLVLLELQEIEQLNNKQSLNLLRLRQLINSFIKEISISYKLSLIHI